MSDLPASLCALMLLVAANSAAWLAGCALGSRFAAPLDCGIMLPDGTRLLGSHKTWRGLIVGALAAALVAPLCGHPAALGFAFGALSLTGDAASSALKRRMRLAPGAQVPLIDQIPEALLPVLALRVPLGLGWPDVALAAGTFTALDVAATAIRSRR
jgi:CDP-2,3-bis-(O-geranylgeranyl)-sn-glycerol synthase